MPREVTTINVSVLFMTDKEMTAKGKTDLRNKIDSELLNLIPDAIHRLGKSEGFEIIKQPIISTEVA